MEGAARPTGGSIMRRFMVLRTVIAVVALGSAVTRLRPPAAAQEATPETAAAATEMVMEGITVEDLAASKAPAFPPVPVDVGLVRLRFAPGGRFVAPRANDLGVALIYVEAGTITTRSTDPLLVMRGAAMATPGAQPSEHVPAETDVT